ncbi:MAG: dihydrodipicolinate synthase family protein [Anaerolineae bacterium]
MTGQMEHDERGMAGVFPIVVTPFDEQGRVDVDSLQNLVDFELAAGVHGLGIALGSEVVRLTEDERALVTRTVVDRVKRQVPVVVNTGGAGTHLALHYSRLAEENGADALMLTGPSFMPVDGEGLRRYFGAVSEIASVPIFIQDINSAHVSADVAREIAEESAWVQYIKVESSPTVRMIQEVKQKAGDVLTPFGGAGGSYFIEELRRGSRGTMPGCSCPEAFVAVWDAFQAGDEARAVEIFYRRIVPINRLEGLGWGAFYHVHKEILRSRGAIATAKVRDPVVPLDEPTRQDLSALIETLYG